MLMMSSLQTAVPLPIRPLQWWLLSPQNQSKANKVLKLRHPKCLPLEAIEEVAEAGAVETAETIMAAAETPTLPGIIQEIKIKSKLIQTNNKNLTKKVQRLLQMSQLMPVLAIGRKAV